MQTSQFDLSGRTAIVTGGGRGIGKGICLALAQAGANIIVAELNPTTAKATAQEVKALGRKSLEIQTDVCSREQVEEMVSKTVGVFGSIDILVNNAGNITPAQMVPALEMNESTWDDVVKLNLKSVFLCSQAVARAMMKEKKGNIINISSVAALQPYPSCVAYAAAKAGVISLTQSLATTLGPYNIRVNSVAPGSIVTEAAEAHLALHPELAELRRKAVPLGRLGTPEDIGWVVAFLASDASGYVTGQIISVDGALAKSPTLTVDPTRVK
jgi:3-oxoacyl-[acyl-carrier protein] reductase